MCAASGYGMRVHRLPDAHAKVPDARVWAPRARGRRVRARAWASGARTRGVHAERAELSGRSAARVRPGAGDRDPYHDPAVAAHDRPVVIPVGVLAGDPPVV